MVGKGQIYKHFKGNYYYIEDIGYDSNSNEEQQLHLVVIYRALYGDHKLWVRSLSDFISEKEMEDGKKIKRFQLITPEFIQPMDRNI